MSTALSAAQVQLYRSQGYLSPLRVLSTEDAARLLALLDDAQARGGPAKDREYYKPHLYYPWVHELATLPTILDAVESVLGPDIFVWGSAFFIKKAGQDQRIHWHQDSLHYGLEPQEAVTAWVALSPSGPENGGLQVIPGSHTAGTLIHDELDSHPGTLFRGSRARGVDEARAVTLSLQPGEMSLHHLCTLHASAGNTSRQRRVGFAIRYVPAQVRNLSAQDSALLARGEDRYGYYQPEQPPVAEGDPDTVARYEAAMALRERVIFGTDTYVVKPGQERPGTGT